MVFRKMRLFVGVGFTLSLLMGCHDETVRNTTPQPSEVSPNNKEAAVPPPSAMRLKPAVRLDVLTTPPESYVNSMPPYQSQRAPSTTSSQN